MSSVVSVISPVGPLGNTTDQAGGVMLRGLVASDWGMDDTGPYYDVAGADALDRALLSVTGTGRARFVKSSGGVGVMRAYPRQESGGLFPAAASSDRDARVYRHESTGQLFPHAPVHASRSAMERPAPPAASQPERSHEPRAERRFPHPPIHAERSGRRR